MIGTVKIETKDFEDVRELIQYLETLPKDTQVHNIRGEDLRVSSFSDRNGNNFAEFE